MSAKLIQGYEVVIGFETHTQLTTQSKLFSRSPIAFGAEPNTQASAVDFALPGALPVMNKGAVQRAIEFGLAVNAHIAESSVFARKNYFYPDLPKGYQISQFEIPVVQGGVVEFFLGDEKKSVRLVRAHLEEDAGKSLHEDSSLGGGGQSGIDLNRAGTPLLEIVTEPDMRSTAEAVAYARELHKIVTWIGICDGNMQEGSFRCDANVSVRKPGAPLGTRREIKNLNSFKFMQQAMDYEIRWQIEQIEDGHAIQQATVLFDPDTGETRSMRSKEDAADYRYFPDPDLPPLVISHEWVEKTRAEMTKLPRERAEQFVADYALSEYDAAQLTQSKAIAEYFQSTAQSSGFPKLAANWVLGELAAHANRLQVLIGDSELPTPMQLAEIVRRVGKKDILHAGAKVLLQETIDRIHEDFVELADFIEFIEKTVREKDLKPMSDSGELEKIIDDVLAANAKNVEEVKAGNAKAFNALVGQAMKASKGKANPAQVNELLKKKLA
ncbi:MAG: Asp-tRNA(Asn)/Glu-tRNA(Gln) amidotransferase subunit GatB [Polaromonas sp.]